MADLFPMGPAEAAMVGLPEVGREAIHSEVGREAMIHSEAEQAATPTPLVVVTVGLATAFRPAVQEGSARPRHPPGRS